MDRLNQRVRRTIEEYHMLGSGDRVIAALSGGADSVCLLALLCQMKEALGIRIRAVHVHHGLRGAEADRDAEFAKAFCAEHDVPCHIIRVDVPGLAAKKGLSEEEAGRILRYEALEREALEWEHEEEGRGGVRIAVAHHSGDQAETILHNMFRGSGLGGLKGIPYVRGRIIRPLLDADRKDILSWLQEQGLPYVTDSTNASVHYTRNRIRSSLLPLIEAEVNQGAAGNILRMGKLAAMADSYLREKAFRWLLEHEEEKAGDNGMAGSFLSQEAFREEAGIIWSYGIMELIKRLAGASKDIGWIHVEQVLGLLERPVGKQVSLPYGLCAVREYTGIFLCRKEGPLKEADTSLPVVETETFSYKNGAQIPKNRYTKWFDCDKIKGTPMVRTRQPGDYITLADGSRKTLKRFMIDEKIPRQIRGSLPLLADGSHVMWVIGYRISGYYRISNCTTRILQARVKGSDAEIE
ncbi:tRNA lysidine(34) synthetase TilS [Lacrimispora sp. 210928-DFI.3.58]|uniref:tRNA lysidine(34) synthetase TilS n=1 Tax=Lacrimispora sp. 210928-DFI.3.58 TaxID=2883214 RepID=UPI0015B56E62|nr:tRNA lysidine(34) synthetase TilS [Lacrimispora sp. 210928-DFI.3.58]MCB7321040.1 tRNA lysidine(34) synthetase TilS [Lacrimispora sp. 210928-DFI.3.58]